MPTLTQPSIGSTSWGTQVNTNWQVLQNQLTNAMQGRIQRDSATQISLQRYTGDTVEVNGLNVSMGSSGIALKTTDNLITSTGADSGGAMAASTLYYLYLSNSNASTFPTQLRASSTVYTSVNGVRYLGSSGNALNWRFIGYVRTDGSTNFQDKASQRFVINYYNRRALPLSVTEAASSWTYATNAWRQANANTANKVETICNGEDAIVLAVDCTCLSGTANGAVGIGLDSTSSNSAVIVTFGPGGNANVPIQALYNSVPAEGYHAFNWLEISPAAGTITFYSTILSSVSSSGIFGFVMG